MLLLPAFFEASTPENESQVVNISSAGSIGGVSLFGSGLDFASASAKYIDFCNAMTGV